MTLSIMWLLRDAYNFYESFKRLAWVINYNIIVIHTSRNSQWNKLEVYATLLSFFLSTLRSFRQITLSDYHIHIRFMAVLWTSHEWHPLDRTVPMRTKAKRFLLIFVWALHIPTSAVYCIGGVCLEMERKI